MPVIKQLYSDDVEYFQDTVIRFIYESVSQACYVESFDEADAEQKCTELSKYLDDGKAIVYGAVDDNNALVGFLWAYEYPFRDDRSRLYVSILHVDERFRGQKIGDFLLSKIEYEAAKRGYGSVFLHTEGINDGAIRFYNRMGYEVERMQMVKKVIK